MAILGICGSRDLTNYEFFSKCVDLFILENKIVVEKIVSGGCRGADSLARRYSKEKKIPLKEHFPKWDTYGRMAGPIRNKLIVDDSTHLLAFPLKGSIGTYNTIDLAKKKKIPVKIYGE